MVIYNVYYTNIVISYHLLSYPFTDPSTFYDNNPLHDKLKLILYYRIQTIPTAILALAGLIIEHPPPENIFKVYGHYYVSVAGLL